MIALYRHGRSPKVTQTSTSGPCFGRLASRQGKTDKSVHGEFLLTGRQAFLKLARRNSATVVHRPYSMVATTSQLQVRGNLPRLPRRTKSDPRKRILDAAYNLFATDGVAQVGIDTILDRSGCAKASLYSHFHSKDELAVAFLDRREMEWTRAWLEAEVKRRTSDPKDRLLAIFDVFDGWFRKKSFEGCSFVNVLLESKKGSPIRRAAANHLAKIRAIVRSLAEDAGLRDPEQFAQAWHMLMKGSIVSAGEGNRNAARDAKRAAMLVLNGWPQKTGRRKKGRNCVNRTPRLRRRMCAIGT